MERVRQFIACVVVLIGVFLFSGATQVRLRFVREQSGSIPGDGACTITAASTSYANVSSAVSSAADGDIVCIPAGTSAWGANTLTVGTKAITIRGAGNGTPTQCAVGGQTTYTCISGTQSPIIDWQTKSTGNSPAGFARLSGITFEIPVEMTGCDTYGSAMLNIYGNSANFRFDHNTVVPRGASNHCGGIIISGYVRGVGDHNSLDLRDNLSHVIIVRHDAWGTTGLRGNCNLGTTNCGDQSWAAAHTLGSANAFYWEDNTEFQTGLGATFQWIADDNNGGRVVHRYNTLTDVVLTQHGTESGGRERGLMQWELYGNTFTWDNGVNSNSLAWRGGYGMVFDNSVTGSSAIPVSFQVQRSNVDKNYYPFSACGIYPVTSITRSGTTATVTHAGPAYQVGNQSYITISGANESAYNGTFTATKTSSTTFTYTVSGSPSTPATGTITIKSPFDGNTGSGTNAAKGYRCIDQIGAGPGRLLTGYGPGFGGSNDITDFTPIGNELRPIYDWNNLLGGVRQQPDNQSPDVILANRDYYTQTASFTGATGVGRGARSSRPATCTTGVGYWSTDGGTNWNTSNGSGNDGGLDICTATNTWTNDVYVPYTYPHPLTTGGN